MLKVDIKKWIQSSTFVRERIWFGYWWASICSAHQLYDEDCDLCNAGHWHRTLARRDCFMFGRTVKDWIEKTDDCK